MDKIFKEFAEFWVDNKGDVEGIEWNVDKIKKAINEEIDERLDDLYSRNDWDKEEIEDMNNIEKAETLFNNQ